MRSCFHVDTKKTRDAKSGKLSACFAGSRRDCGAAIGQLMNGNRSAWHGGRVYGNAGRAVAYMHIPNTNNRGLLGYSDLDLVNHTVVIQCTGTMNNGRHEMNTRGEF